MVHGFDDQTNEVFQKLVHMGHLAQWMLRIATRCLLRHKEAFHAQVQQYEQEVKSLRNEIDERAISLTATQHAEVDIPFLFTAARVAAELEHIGDEAGGVCKNAARVIEFIRLKALVDLPGMSEIAEGMVHDAVQALVHCDHDLASRVLDDEQRIYACRDGIFQRLFTYMMVDPATIERTLVLMLIAHNLERIGALATNVAKEVIHLIHGREIRASHEFGDATDKDLSRSA